MQLSEDRGRRDPEKIESRPLRKKKTQFHENRGPLAQKFYASGPLFFYTAFRLSGLEMAALRRYTIAVVLCPLVMVRCPPGIKEIPEWKRAAGSKACEDENEIR